MVALSFIHLFFNIFLGRRGWLTNDRFRLFKTQFSVVGCGSFKGEGGSALKAERGRGWGGGGREIYR